MEKIKILLLDDDPDDLKHLNDLVAGCLERNRLSDFAVIDKTDSFKKAKEFLVDSDQNCDFYSILFVDINLSETDGAEEGGIEIMKKAYTIFPFSVIIPWSNNVGKPKDYPDLAKKGKIIDGFKKDMVEVSFENLFIPQVTKCLDNFYLQDIYINHFPLEQGLPSADIAGYHKAEIHSLIEVINVLFRDMDRMDSKDVFYRLIIFLYHRCLELFCSRKGLGNNNFASSIVGTNTGAEADNDDDDSALSKIKSFSTEEKYPYGSKLNRLRNKSVHPDSKKNFSLTFANILFANLTLAIYASKTLGDIQIRRIEAAGNAKSDKGQKWLNEAIRFIREETISK